METRSNDVEWTRAESPGSPTMDPVEAVLDAVSEASGRPVLPDADTAAAPLPPLYDAIDPDAFDSLVRSVRAGAQVTFDYAGYEVAVTASEGASVVVDVV